MFKDAPPRINFNTSYVSVIRSYGVVNKFIILWRGKFTGYWKKSKSKPTLYISRWHIPDNCDTTKWFFSIYFLYHILQTCYSLWQDCQFSTSGLWSVRCLKVLCLLLKAKFKIIFTPRNVPRPVADAHHLVKVCALLLKQQRYQSAEIIFLVLFIRFVYHLTSLKPSMTHFTLAEGIFTRALQYNLYLLLW